MDIYVGSLPFKMKEDELRELFENYGEVSSAKIIIDKMTRQSKGFGFVEMPDETQAKEAIANLHGQEVMGRALIVNESQKNDRPGGGPRSGGGGNGGYRSGGDYPRRDSGSKPFNKYNDRGGDKKWDRGGRDNDRKGGYNKRDRDEY